LPLPGVLTRQNAAAWLAWVWLALPSAAIVALASGRAATAAPVLLPSAVLCLAADVVLLRDPLEARIGDVAAAAVPLASWAIAAAFQWPRPHWIGALRLGAAALLGVSGVAVAVFAAPSIRRGPVDDVFVRMKETPPSMALLSSSRTSGIVEYLRACTGTEDRVLAAWFAPEVYYFSGRGFAGGMVVYFGGHWSRPTDQRRVLRRMQGESVPIAIVDLRSYAEFRRDFATIDAFLTSEYDIAAESSMGDPEGMYRILVRRGTVPVRTYTAESLPCFQ
jgi:hypothetical protein